MASPVEGQLQYAHSQNNQNGYDDGCHADGLVLPGSFCNEFQDVCGYAYLHQKDGGVHLATGTSAWRHPLAMLMRKGRERFVDAPTTNDHLPLGRKSLSETYIWIYVI